METVVFSKREQSAASPVSLLQQRRRTKLRISHRVGSHSNRLRVKLNWLWETKSFKFPSTLSQQSQSFTKPPKTETCLHSENYFSQYKKLKDAVF